MTIPTWPSDLPRPERDSWRRSPLEARLKRQTERGPHAYRRRFSSVARTVQLSIVVNENGRAVFDRFYEETTAWGSLPFYMADPTTDGRPMLDATGAPMLTADGEPVLISAIWLCLFGDNLPEETLRGVEFRLSFDVVVMP